MKVDLYNSLLALQAVARKGSFTAAAGELGVSTSALSQTIKQLERNLGCILLNRSTRSVSLTELGTRLLEKSQPALQQLQSALEDLGQSRGQPTGTLRLNLPRSAWPTVLAPALQDFQSQYPDIKLELYFEESLIDIVKGGFDAGIRNAEAAPADMTAIRISPPFRFVVAGAPDYLNRQGRPQHPSDLVQHDCIPYRFDSSGLYRRWEFETQGQAFTVTVDGPMILNDALIMLDCGVRGLGLIYTTSDLAAGPVARGELELLLEDYAPTPDCFYLYYPDRHQVSPKLRALIDFLKARQRPSPHVSLANL